MARNYPVDPKREREIHGLQRPMLHMFFCVDSHYLLDKLSDDT